MASIWFLGSTDLPQFIITVLSNGLVGLAVAWIIERAPGWNTPPTWLPAWASANWPRFKRWTVFGGAVALPLVVAVVLYGAGPQFIGQTGVFASLAAQGLVMWLGTQVGHVVDPALMRALVKALIEMTPYIFNAKAQRSQDAKEMR